MITVYLRRRIKQFEICDKPTNGIDSASEQGYSSIIDNGQGNAMKEYTFNTANSINDKKGKTFKAVAQTCDEAFGKLCEAHPEYDNGRFAVLVRVKSVKNRG